MEYKINMLKWLFSQINLNSNVKSEYNLRNKNNYFIPYAKIIAKNKNKKLKSTFSIFFCKL